MTPTYRFLVARGVRIWRGSLVALRINGLAIPGGPGRNLFCVGIAKRTVDNRRGRRRRTVNVEQGIFLLDWGGRGKPARVGVAMPLYMVDDHTVSLSSRSGSRSLAGCFFGTDGDQVAVRIAP